MSKIKCSLSRKLSLDIMLMAVPVFVLSLGIFYLQSRYLIRQEAIEHSNSILKTTIQCVGNYMSTIETSVNGNAWLLEENFRPDSLQAISQRIVRSNPNILSCSVSIEPEILPQYGEKFSIYTENDNGTIASVVEKEYDYFSRDWYKTPVYTGKACWVGPFSDYSEGAVDHNEAVGTYSRPLRSDKGQILGVVSADFSFAQLAKTIGTADCLYADAYFVLIGGDGRYFIHPDSTRLFKKTVFTDTDPTKNADKIALGHEMTDGKQGMMHVNVDGRRCHVCYQPVPGTDWSLAMVCPDSEVLIGYHRLGYVIVILIVIGLLAILWLSQKVVRQNISSINKLLRYTKDIEEGNYDETIPRSDQDDDIGHLQNSFAAMQQALHVHMRDINNTADELRKHNERSALDMKLAEETIRKKALFIQNLSHQIRTPLNIITGFANVLHENIVLRSQGKDEAVNKFHKENLSDITGMMKYNAIHLKRMILMLFDSSSVTGAEQLMNDRKDEVSCNAVARESIDYTEEHFLGVKIRFETELSDAVHILTNHLYLMRSIRELLYNAAKFSDGKHICLHVYETRRSVCFKVEDVGPGLPENAEELLYKPFVKNDNMSEGLGLGLPLTKRHALSLGGDLIYDPDYKDGCCFVLELPK